MPQMAPYNWLNLYIMFTLILIYLISYIYYIYNTKCPKSKKWINKNNFNWKW